MSFGLSAQELTYFKDKLVKPLFTAGAKVWVFGSRARGEHRQHSDLDVLVQYDGKDNLAPILSNIREVFEEGNFPYKVDLVLLSDLADSYRENVLRDRQLVDLK
jgi:predicted nucleotidyltransferase